MSSTIISLANCGKLNGINTWTGADNIFVHAVIVEENLTVEQQLLVGLGAFIATGSSTNVGLTITADAAQSVHLLDVCDSLATPQVFVDQDFNFDLNGHQLINIGPGGFSFVSTGAADSLLALLPLQTGNSGKVLGTNGTVASWVTGPPSKTFTRGTGTVTVASTAFVDVTGLSASIGANETWVYHIVLPITGAANGMKFQVTGPASPTAVEINYRGAGTSGSGAMSGHLTAFSSGSSGAMFSNAFDADLDIFILVVNGSNAGTIQVQFATVSGTNTITALANRWIEGERKA